jgi:LmbE family N-acetylglucosaminyl deacetylase
MMNVLNGLTLMAILAHPDDESLATGGILARYAAEGVATHLVTATRGQRGWAGPPADNPGPVALGQLRERELRAAARVLGLRQVHLLDYMDGALDQADPAAVIAQLAGLLRRVRPQVVVTFGPDGVYGHPDHIAISQLTTAAVAVAADPAYRADQAAVTLPHRVAKLYYRAWTDAERAIYAAAFGELIMPVDGVDRRLRVWPDWAITTQIDTAAHWATVWEAVTHHQSQLPNYRALAALPLATHRTLWSVQSFYRALSLVNGGRQLERDLFEGLREPAAQEVA